MHLRVEDRTGGSDKGGDFVSITITSTASLSTSTVRDLDAFRTFLMELSEEMHTTIEAVRELACA